MGWAGLAWAWAWAGLGWAGLTERAGCWAGVLEAAGGAGWRVRALGSGLGLELGWDLVGLKMERLCPVLWGWAGGDLVGLKRKLVY